jgi:hypothetical protein
VQSNVRERIEIRLQQSQISFVHKCRARGGEGGKGRVREALKTEALRTRVREALRKGGREE